MKKLIILVSFLIAFNASASFKPATLYIEYKDAIVRSAVYTEAQADYLFGVGFKLEQEQMLGATVTTINATDRISDSRAVINTNFDNLNAGKIEISTTTLPNITTLTNLVTVGTIGTGVWQGTDIGVAYGGTGTSSPSRYQVILGDGSSGLTVASSTGASGQSFVSNGAGAYPEWKSVGVDETDAYNWTGLHDFAATTTMATTTINQLQLNDVDVTSTATELNALDGISADVTATNLNTLTAGTSTSASHLHSHNSYFGASDDSVMFAYPIGTEVAALWTTADVNFVPHTNYLSCEGTNATWNCYITLPGNGTDETFQSDDSKKIIFEAFVRYINGGNGDAHLGFGEAGRFVNNYDNDNDGATFAIDGTTLYAGTGNGSASTEVDISAGITVTNWNLYKIVYDSAVGIEFYVNGTLKTTISTTISSASQAMFFGVGGTTSSDDFWISVPVIRQEL